ncbi:MAG: glycosyltransferase family 4 protein [Planctomycetota bacterium]
MAKSNPPVELIVGDWHHRFTGVSATVANLLPTLAENERLAVMTQRECAFPKLGFLQTLRLCWSKPDSKPFRIFHARRNIELGLGFLMRRILRRPVRVVFTSAAKRRHSWVPRMLIDAADVQIATTPEAASFLRDDAPVIPHSVDCQRFQPAADVGLLRKKFRLDADKIVTIVGRVRPEKDTDLFVDAMCRLLPQHPGTLGCIVGTATDAFAGFADDLKAKLAARGLDRRVVWLGQLPHDELAELVSCSSICVAPARYEGFGLVPLEAMACGVPVVASRTGAYEQFVRPGETGFLTDCGDEDGLVEALDILLSDDAMRADFGYRGRQLVTSQYSVEMEASRIRDVYLDLWKRAA